MTNETYIRAANTATRLLAKYGAELTIRSAPVKSDPQTGQGGSAGVDRSVVGVISSLSDGVFSESLRKAGDRMLVLAPEANVEIGETWVEGLNHWPILDLKTISPDGETVVAYRALVRG